MVARAWEDRERGSCYSTRTERVSVLQDEKVLEISYTTNGHTVNKNLLQG